VKHLFKWGAIHQIGNGKLTQFWEDVWLTSSPLRLSFPALYIICNNKSISVSECANMGWQVQFRRMLGQEEMEEWMRLQEAVRGIVIHQEEDTILWGLTTSKQFITNSLY
jgi:hypothetical protein